MVGDSRAGQVVLDRRVLIVADLAAPEPFARRATPLASEGFCGVCRRAAHRQRAGAGRA